MNIIEFIFDNPFILVILIGILSGVFGRKKQEQQRRNQPQKKSTGPVAQPFEFPWEDRTEEDEPAHPKNMEEDLSDEYEEDVWELEESVLEAEPANEEKPLVAIQEKAMASSSLQPIDREKALAVPHDVSPVPKGGALERSQAAAGFPNKAVNFRKVNRQQVVQGIIWSQILGQPRAREPHRPRNFQYGQRRS